MVKTAGASNGLGLPFLCIVIFYCCSVQLAEACPFLQKKVAAKIERLRFERAATAAVEDECTTSGGHDHLEMRLLRANREDDKRRARVMKGCGSNFCFGSLAPSLPPLVLDWSTLAAIAEPTSLETGYMEDTQNRSALTGIDIQTNNEGASFPAGHTYVGQLLSHDVNLDETTMLGEPVDPATIPNVNTPMIDLDTIYSFHGCTPRLNGAKFITNERDFERSSSGEALICDVRNDGHRIVSQLIVAWMTLHNDFVDNYGYSFDEAREATIKEWQAVVLSDFLPNILDGETISSVEDGDRVLFVGEAYDTQQIPVEFSTAAYRLLHSRTRGLYRLNDLTDGSDDDEPSVRFFDVGLDEHNLLGGSVLPDIMVIDWDRFFVDPEEDLGITEVARILDMLYSPPLMRMPFDEPGTFEGPQIVVECDSAADSCPIVVDVPEVCPLQGTTCEVRANLALLDLLRGQTHSLPGGIAFAEYAQTLLPSLDVLSVADMAGNVFGLPGELPEGTTDVPLLLYLAHESIRDSNGEVLGKLGSRIIAEVIYGIIETTTPSILGGDPFVSLVTGGSTVTMLNVLDYIGWH